MGSGGNGRLAFCGAGLCAAFVGQSNAFVLSPPAGAVVTARPKDTSAGFLTTGQQQPSAAGTTTAVVGCAFVTAALLGRASGLQPRSGRRGASATAVRAFEDELGVQAPLGYFDPLGFSADGDLDTFFRRREAEIKNGRVAMFATMGYMLPEYYRFPGYLSPSLDLRFEDMPNGLEAFDKMPAEGWLQIVALCGYWELVVNQPLHPTEPGNYYKGRLGIFNRSWGPSDVAYQMPDPDKRRYSLNAEIANGRLAMIAITGMMVQNGLAGSTGPEMWLPF
mmetsp:Transcript_70947/g.154141  ORF Transcript_70947/g.154141 Transcript_70947/m.154141 type:complete len:278 (-) Transcript_70947:83-916(-)